MQDVFDSEFSYVEYKPQDNVVFLKWKKFCCLEDYRKPTTFALELLRKYKNSNFVVDATDGFEDDKRDVEWGFKFLLPEMAKTDCKVVAFIMKEVNDIETEMNMWCREFGKYFKVIFNESYEKSIEAIGRM